MPTDEQEFSATQPIAVVEQTGIQLSRAQFFFPVVTPGGMPVRQIDRQMQALRHPVSRQVGRSQPNPRKKA